MKKFAIGGLALAAVVAVAMSAGGGGEAAACAEAPATLQQAIAEGLTLEGGGGLRNAYVAEAGIGQDFRGVESPVYLVSAEIVGPGFEGEVGTWIVTRSLEDAGLIVAADPLAQEFSTWGEAAEEGSPVDAWRDRIAEDDTAAATRECAGP